MSATLALKSALRELPPPVLDRIKETVDSDEPIAVGAWTRLLVVGACGCLLTNGYHRRYPESQLHGHYETPATLEILTNFYGVHSSYADEFSHAARAFDMWAPAGMVILRADHRLRQDLREIMAEVTQ